MSDSKVDLSTEVECCNADCGWKGPLSKCLMWKHDTGARICPECHEVVEPLYSEERSGKGA